jgi:hypothetical protein
VYAPDGYDTHPAFTLIATLTPPPICINLELRGQAAQTRKTSRTVPLRRNDYGGPTQLQALLRNNTWPSYDEGIGSEIDSHILFYLQRGAPHAHRGTPATKTLQQKPCNKKTPAEWKGQTRETAMVSAQFFARKTVQQRPPSAPNTSASCGVLFYLRWLL